MHEARIRENSNVGRIPLTIMNMITQAYTDRSSMKGGLVTYSLNSISLHNLTLHNTYSTWEGLFVDIIDDSRENITICNIIQNITICNIILRKRHDLRTHKQQAVSDWLNPLSMGTVQSCNLYFVHAFTLPPNVMFGSILTMVTWEL